MRVFLRAHGFGDARQIIPASRLLTQCLSTLQGRNLARDFVFQGTARSGKRIHVLDLDLSTQLGAALRANRDIHIAPDHPLLHVAVADPAAKQDIGQSPEVSVGHLRSIEFGL